MRHLKNGLLAAAALLALGIAAQAQYGAREGPYQPDRVDALVERVQADLNRGYNVWHLTRGERDRLNHAHHELREFAQRWHHAKFDKGRLDDAISAVQHVLDRNNLRGPERDALWEDVGNLRRMREAYERREIGRW